MTVPVGPTATSCGSCKHLLKGRTKDCLPLDAGSDSLGQQRGQYLTATANLHFFLAFLPRSTFTQGAIEEPTEMSGLKLPGWTVFLAGAFSQGPAFFPLYWGVSPLIDHQKKQLAFHIEGNAPPALFIALHRLEGYAQETGKGFLGFIEFLTVEGKVFRGHILSRDTLIWVHGVLSRNFQYTKYTTS